MAPRPIRRATSRWPTSSRTSTRTSLQNEIGIFSTAGSIYPVYKIELHADCWAGVWAKSAEDEGILDPGDITEASQTTLDLGDYAFDNPQHHGTPEQRNQAFLEGYDGGDEGSCDGWLNDTY
ncbi:neutral zinc metallopeptidase [Cryobacterium breve]|uniref:neutral zinc metallopeptidase n=1 Tax=Cryobacterium breve TaxID=1259258 RepID=UPI003D7C24CF